MAIDLIYQSGTQTATLDTQHNLGNNPDASDGIYQFFVDLSKMQRADRTVIRVYETIVDASPFTQELVKEFVFTNEQTEPLFVSPSLMLGIGWALTLEQTDGTGRDYHWRIARISQ